LFSTKLAVTNPGINQSVPDKYSLDYAPERVATRGPENFHHGATPSITAQEIDAIETDGFN